MESEFLGLGKRLGQYLEYKNISMNQLGRLIGTSSGQISIIISGKKFGADKLLSIISVLPSLNPSWLLTGSGDMEKTEGEGNNSQTGTGNFIGNRNKQKNINGIVPGAGTAEYTNVTELQQELKACRDDKDQLSKQLFEVQQKLIQTLENQNK